ncbi:leukotriene B4 receptor 1-like [Rhineura floridana]|uniref:leukotriene B4 receptor 1-like n=1 Tax=Rhineura floridana TaxID=261503 RepID=UPI002AC7FCEC|nr:leukotriene B4 receptor 1-like [Rhineura floridana]
MGLSEESNEHLSLSIARSLVCTVLSLSFITGVPGNSFVIWTICGRMTQRPPTVVLILHLAIADLLVLITLPIWIYSFANAWPFELEACKALAFVIYSSMYASIFLVMALSFERFMAVFYPFAVQHWKYKMASNVVVSAIWILAIAFGAIIIPFQETDDTEVGLQCTARIYPNGRAQEVACCLLETLVGFIMPFAFISVCYICVGKRIGQMTCPLKRRSARLITSIVVAFCLCWLPHHVFNLISVASALIEDSYPEMSEALRKISAIGVYIVGSVAFISSCINPLLYAFASRNIQSSVRITKLSRLFEQMSPSERKKPTCPNGKEENLTSTEMT